MDIHLAFKVFVTIFYITFVKPNEEENGICCPTNSQQQGSFKLEMPTFLPNTSEVAPRTGSVDQAAALVC